MVPTPSWLSALMSPWWDLIMPWARERPKPVQQVGLDAMAGVRHLQKHMGPGLQAGAQPGLLLAQLPGLHADPQLAAAILHGLDRVGAKIHDHLL